MRSDGRNSCTGVLPILWPQDFGTASRSITSSNFQLLKCNNDFPFLVLGSSVRVIRVLRDLDNVRRWSKVGACSTLRHQIITYVL